MKRWFKIPIYDADVLVVVADDAVAAARRYRKTFGFNIEPGAWWRAYCAHNGELCLGMFFQAPMISHNDIAHEIKHLVNFIKESIGDVPCCAKKSDEPDAYLAGYITQRVYRLLKKNNVTIYND